MRCPKCSSALIQKAGGGVKVRIEGPLSVNQESASGRCYWCKAEVDLPLRLIENFSVPEPRLVIIEKGQHKGPKK